MTPKVKVGVHIFLTEDGHVGMNSTSQNELTIVGLLMKGIQLAQSPIKQPEPNRIVIPEL